MSYICEYVRKSFEKSENVKIGKIWEVARCILIHMGVITNGNKDQNHEI